MQTQHSFRELATKQEKHCAKCNFGLKTKLLNAVQTQKIGLIEGENVKHHQKMVSKKHGKRARNSIRKIRNKERMCALTRMQIQGISDLLHRSGE